VQEFLPRSGNFSARLSPRSWSSVLIPAVSLAHLVSPPSIIFPLEDLGVLSPAKPLTFRLLVLIPLLPLAPQMRSGGSVPTVDPPSGAI
jgi:hypothetical protein